MASAPLATNQLEDADRFRIVETARAGASWIEKQDAVALFVVRQVAMAENDDVGALVTDCVANVRGEPLRTVKDMNDVKLEPSEVCTSVDSSVSTLKAVDVPGRRRHRRNFLEIPEQRLTTDVSSVKNMIDAGKVLPDRWIEFPVCVGDDADAHGGVVVLGAGC